MISCSIYRVKRKKENLYYSFSLYSPCLLFLAALIRLPRLPATESSSLTSSRFVRRSTLYDLLPYNTASTHTYVCRLYQSACLILSPKVHVYISSSFFRVSDYSFLSTRVLYRSWTSWELGAAVEYYILPGLCAGGGLFEKWLRFSLFITAFILRHSNLLNRDGSNQTGRWIQLQDYIARRYDQRTFANILQQNGAGHTGRRHYSYIIIQADESGISKGK